MQNIYDIHDYDEFFIEQFTTQTLPIYDLWSIRPMQNEVREIISGTSEEIDKFKNFIVDHAEKDYPHPLTIIVGNAENSNPNNMANRTKLYFKIKFDKFKGNDIGNPLPYGYTNNPAMPVPFMGLGGGHKIQEPIQQPGISYTEIQGIIDRNVSDATRSIRAEYEETAAKREAESIKRIAELEMKMEFYKLDIRAREIEEKERKLNEELDELEQRRAEGLGSVKDYTKTIAGGLLEVGKTAFGIEDSSFDKASASTKVTADKSEDKKAEKGNRSSYAKASEDKGKTNLK